MKPYIVFRYGEDLVSEARNPLNIAADRGIATVAGSTTQATVSVTLNSDGTITYIGAGSPGSWHTDPAAGLGSSFWAIVTLTSGAVTTGTVGSRVSLASGAGWTVTTSGTDSVRTSTAVGTIELWDAASGGNKVSEGTFNLLAQVQATSTVSGGTGGGGLVKDTDYTFQDFEPLQPV